MDAKYPTRSRFRTVSHTLWWEQFTSASITSAMNEVTQQTAAVVPLARAIAVIFLVSEIGAVFERELC